VDTRTKILTPAALAVLDPPRPLVAVAGRFELLRAETVRELADARRRTGARSLVAVLRPFAGELAAVEARAELVAALRVVDYVFIAPNEDFTGLAASLEAIETVNLEEADAGRIRQLIEHVRSRQST